MPNGGRRGDNPQSWFMDRICRGEVFLGDPIDQLICEIYRITGDEYASGVSLDEDKEAIDPVALEAKLREKLRVLKAGD